MATKSNERRKLGRAEARALDIEISFLEGVVRRDPAYEQALRVLGDDYAQRGRHTDGLQIDETLARLHPNDPSVIYNLACSYVLTQRFDDAFTALFRALDSGYSDFKWISRDPDMKPLRTDPRWKKVRERIRASKTAGPR